MKNLVKTQVQENKNAPSGLISNHFEIFSMYFQDTSMFSTQSSTETNKLMKETVDDIVENLDANEEDEHIPYRPPSFQDYSSDSAKALMTKYENKGSLTPQAESSRRLPCQVTVRRTRSLEEPKNSTENEEVSLIF